VCLDSLLADREREGVGPPRLLVVVLVEDVQVVMDSGFAVPGSDEWWF